MRFSDWSSDVCSSDLGVIGYVPQALEFDRGLPMTVDDFMAAMCQRRPAFPGLSKHYVTAIGQALERVGMQHKRKPPIGPLSGAQRRRALLPLAHIPAPQPPVLDEPISALAEALIQMSEQLLRALRKAAHPMRGTEHEREPTRPL